MAHCDQSRRHRGNSRFYIVAERDGQAGRGHSLLRRRKRLWSCKVAGLDVGLVVAILL